MIDFLRTLFSGSSGTAHPLSDGSPGDASPSGKPGQPAPDLARNAAQPAPISPRVLAIIHNPVMRARGQKIQAAYRWNDPDKLAQGYIDDLREASSGLAQYQIVDRIEVDGFPVKRDGFSYSDASFERAWSSRQFHQPDAVDYLALVRQFHMIERVNADEIDEVWLLGFPYCGYYESIMAGPGAFWCNAPPLEGTADAKRRFVIMGFNYERGVGEMLEDMGHRVESIMSRVYQGTHGEDNLWERFTRYDRTHPQRAECGNVHFAPNSQRDYDWGNPTPVSSRADSWYNFPDLAGEARTMTCSEWGNGDTRAHHLWWLRHLPHFEGEIHGVRSNWWEYVLDPNRVRA